jgi:hypothetical protein
VEGKDYIIVANSGDGGMVRFSPIDYYLTLDMAKELSTVERATREGARHFSIECDGISESTVSVLLCNFCIRTFAFSSFLEPATAFRLLTWKFLKSESCIW